MTQPTLVRQQRIGRHLRIILDDAPRRNALSGEMVDEIDAILTASREEGLASLIIEGANGVFSAGADLKSLAGGAGADALAGRRGSRWKATTAPAANFSRG